MTFLSKFSMKNVTAVLILVVLLFGTGIYSAASLKVENFPDISFPVVMVSTTYQAPPKDVAEQVTKPLEKAISGLADIDTISSTSSDNYSQIVIQFNQGVDTEKKKQDVANQIQSVPLPADAKTPKVQTFGFASLPQQYLALSADHMTQNELNKLYTDVIEPELNALPGFDHADAIGTSESKIDIKLDADALNQYGLSVASVTNSIRSGLSSGPTGSAKISGNSEMVRVTGDFDSIFALDNMAITSPSVGTLQLKQIAKVEAISDSNYIARYNNEPTIGINLYKTKDGNAVEFSDAMQKLIKQWEVTQPQLHFKSLFDQADSVRESINGMLREGSLGALLACIMILLFLRNMRMTLIVLVSIPLSICITLIVMSFLGITLNIMTLGGMAIAVGRVVDDSIVVIENIYVQLQKRHERDESVILFATKQVASAITSSTLTTVGVFAPLGLVSGMVGEIFRPFAITLATALLSSLLVALTVIPLLANILVLRSGKIHHHEELPEGPVLRSYKKVLIWTLNRRKRTLFMAFLLFVLTLGLVIPRLDVGFVPSGDAGRQMYYQIKLPYETSLDSTNEKVKQLEAMLQGAKDPSGQKLFTFTESLVGYTFGQGIPGSDSIPYMAVILTELNKNDNTEQVKDAWKTKLLNELPKGSTVDLSELGGGGVQTGDDFSYTLAGDDQNTLQESAKTIKQKMQQFPELREIKDNLDDTKMEVDVKVDPDKANLYGLDAGQVMSSVRAWIMQTELSDMKFDNETFTTKIEIDDAYKNSVDAISKMIINTATGQTINLGDIAKVEQVEAPSSVHREKQEQVVKVTAKIDSNNKSGVSKKVAAELDKIELPSGVHREVGGVNSDIGKSFGQLFVAMAVAICIVYFIMILAFGNAGAPFAILFSLPLAAIGGILGLFIMHQSLDVTSLIGFMMLIGIVVTNAIVLVDRVQQLKLQGIPTRMALVEAGMSRLRPIIMTAVATIFALLPLALGLSKGTIISQGLADVVIGGLTTSTLLTLVVVPVVYEIIDAMKERIGNRRKRKSKPGSMPESGSQVTL